MRKKITGLPPNFDFNPLPTRFNFTKFLPTSMHSESMQHIKRASKHGISIVLKLVSIEYQKRAGCISGSCVAREKQTDISEQPPVAPPKKSFNSIFYFYPLALTCQHCCVWCTISKPVVQYCDVHLCTTLLYTAI